MDQIRYKERLYTPGDNSPPKHELVRFNEEVKADWDAIQTRRRELSARLAAINSEQADIKNNLGAWIAEGCDWREHTDRLQDLRAEAEAVQAGIDYLNNQAELMKRSHAWLSTSR